MGLTREQERVHKTGGVIQSSRGLIRQGSRQGAYNNSTGQESTDCFLSPVMQKVLLR